MAKKPKSKTLLTLTKRQAVVAAIVLLTICGIVGGIYAYHERGSKEDQELRKITAEIGRHALLPDKEQPGLLTVTDPSKLGHQKFFKDAKSGDKVLVYSENNKVILYRPSERKVVNMGPVDIAPIATPAP